MRKIYTDNFRMHSITQGSIISNCIANEFQNADISGLIITPRCDLAHGIKVETVHYLPIIPLSQWMESIGKFELYQQVKDQLRQILNQWIKEKKKIKGDFMLSSMCTKDSVEEILNETHAKEKQIEASRIYFDTDEASLREYIKKNDKCQDNLKNRIAGNGVGHFYLVEDWAKENEYQIILLREIHQISRESAKKMNPGFFSDEVDSYFFEKNSLRRPQADESLAYEILAEIKSPYVEHILQHFTHHFSRIGVEDREDIDLLKYV